MDVSSSRLRPGDPDGRDPGRKDEESPGAAGEDTDGAAEQVPEDEFTHQRGAGIDGQELRRWRELHPANG
jgi:hypothetical protein